VDAGQPGGLAGAAPLGHVPADGRQRLGRESGVEERGALALGEAGLASGAAEQAGLVRPLAHGHGQVAVAALPVVGAVGVEAAKPRQVVHGRSIRG
jgi:hypothetical protein